MESQNPSMVTVLFEIDLNSDDVRLPEQVFLLISEHMRIRADLDEGSLWDACSDQGSLVDINGNGIGHWFLDGKE